ncbi:hypothetical protein HPB51_026762 [Rhipicephalus microplus]|uniref:CCHC-type domain-containing protein n=2 Tax=Rhipicephalus microplus TaxID=6941 RepID=A0A9J6D288_RHIMP|nr:hypothetical protein HPB51_026762 [Rhipicephalus microplus]
MWAPSGRPPRHMRKKSPVSSRLSSSGGVVLETPGPARPCTSFRALDHLPGVAVPRAGSGQHSTVCAVLICCSPQLRCDSSVTGVPRLDQGTASVEKSKRDRNKESIGSRDHRPTGVPPLSAPWLNATPPSSLAPPAKDRPAGRPGRGRGVAPKHSSSGHHRRPGLTTLGAVHFNIVRGTLARTVPASRRLRLAAAALPCSSCEPVTMAAAELGTQPSQPSSAPKRSAKRVADSQMGIDDLSASATPASKRECPSPAAVASPGTESKYKVVVKPRECFDVSKLSNRLLQSAFDTCLKTTAFQGFSIHHPTNSVSVWVRSLADVDRLTHLQTLPVTADCTVQVQAYLSSGSDLRRYVVSGVDPGESPEGLITALTCSTHKIVTARYMGRGRTCLVTLQGPRTPPSRITYYGCILKFHVYKPGVVHCYRCFRTGHMRDSCPQPADTSMESVETRTYKCGLCQTDDHEITSKDCPVKQKALKARRQRKRRQRSVTQEERDADIPTSNRFELLSPSEEDTPALVEPENACYEVPTYSDAVKRGKKRVQQPANTPKLSVTGTDDLAKLDQQIQQLQMEVKRLAQRRTHLARPAGPTAMRGTDVPYAASVPELSCASASAPVKMTPAELLHFVARQLQELSKVVLANLPPQ